jgi:hypothetical protein
VPQVTPSYIAKGDINSSRFVKSDGTNDFAVVEGTANAEVRGIAMEGSREAPIPSVTSPLAAKTGEGLLVYGNGQQCLLELGGTVSAGDVLKSDSAGKGVVIATGGDTLQHIGAVALEGGVSAEKILVEVDIRSERPVATS